jgi:DNA repair exonuclease SbcCD ATPase subunit
MEPSDSASLRHRLGEIITRRQETETRLSQLDTAQLKANEQLRAAYSRLADCNEALQRAEANEQSRLANAFLDGAETADNPVLTAKAAVSAAEDDISKYNTIEAALTAEVSRVQSSLNSVRAIQLELIAELVSNSPEYQSLIAAHKAAWKQLRTVKTALRTVTRGCAGYLPQNYIDEASKVEPLEPRVNFDCFPLVSQWESVMQELQQDASAELPRIE